MAGKAGNSKKPRTRGPNASRQRGSTITTGNRGSKRTPMVGLQRELVSMGKGAFTRQPRLGDKPFAVNASREPFDAGQAKKNRLAGLCD